MNLLTLREKFVRLSGRYELVSSTATWADNGADFYIRLGQKLLEGLVTTRQTRGNIYLPLAIGEYSLSWPNSCRVIEDIFLQTTSGRTQLEKISLLEFRNYFAEPTASTDNGIPLFWTVADLRGLETTAKEDVGTFLDNVFDEDSTDRNYSGILIGPPASEAVVIQIMGLFDQFELTSDTDENYWSLEQSGLLLKAALYQLETFGRGTAHHKSWIDSIKLDVYNIECDRVDEESHGIDQIRG